MAKGDEVFFYHSVSDKAIVGLATVIKTAYPDPTVEPDEKAEWFCVDLKAGKALPKPVTLEAIKAHRALKNILLVRQSRLSVCPVDRKRSRRVAQAGRIVTSTLLFLLLRRPWHIRGTTMPALFRRLSFAFAASVLFLSSPVHAQQTAPATNAPASNAPTSGDTGDNQAGHLKPDRAARSFHETDRRRGEEDECRRHRRRAEFSQPGPPAEPEQHGRPCPAGLDLLPKEAMAPGGGRFQSGGETRAHQRGAQIQRDRGQVHAGTI